MSTPCLRYLQHEDGRYQPCPPRAHEGGGRQRQHHDEGHVVGGHARECRCGEYERKRKGSRAPESRDDGSGRHWHGAAADHWMSHVAFEAPGTACANEWCEPVTDEEYAALSLQ